MRNILGALAVLGCLCWANTASAQSAKVDYARDIQPVLAQTCSGCHGPAKFSAGLRVDSVASLLRGGRSGPAIVPGKAGESLLVKKADEDDPTPHKGRVLTAEQIVLLKAWINQGAQTGDRKTATTPKPAIVEVDLSKLPPELAREIIEALNKNKTVPK
jgi:mono/diheme cytochrome c family protein